MNDFPFFSFISSSYIRRSEISQDRLEYRSTHRFSEAVYSKHSSEYNLSLARWPCLPLAESVLWLKPQSLKHGYDLTWGGLRQRSWREELPLSPSPQLLAPSPTPMRVVSWPRCIFLKTQNQISHQETPYELFRFGLVQTGILHFPEQIRNVSFSINYKKKKLLNYIPYQSAPAQSCNLWPYSLLWIQLYFPECKCVFSCEVSDVGHHRGCCKTWLRRESYDSCLPK